MVFLYHFVWTFALILLIPPVLFSRRRRWTERLGLGLPAAGRRRDAIWIHALSVGEVLSALPLVDSLARAYPGKDLHFTAATAKGTELARRELGGKVKSVLTMPLDGWWCVRRVVKAIGPSVFVLVETDLWPGLLDHLKRLSTELAVG